MNFVDINTKKIANINYAKAVTEALYFWHSVLFCRKRTFWCLFSEIYVSLINCDIVFCKLNFLLALFLLSMTFFIISKLYNQAKLTELHERILVASFLCILIRKVNMDKLK